jgi:hypothetical protein
MLYDLASGPPKPGTLLESLFVLMAKRRQEAEYFKTKVLMIASLADKLEEGGKMLDEAMEVYRNNLFPFLGDEKKKQDKEHKEVLKQWTKYALKIRPLWRAQDNRAIVSKLRRGAERTKQSEDLRRKKVHRRI